MKRLALSLGAFLRGVYSDRPFPFEACLAHARESGYEGVELGARAPHPTPESCPTRAQREDVRRALAEAGLTLSGISTNFHGLSPVQHDHQAYVERFETNLQFAADLGARTFRVDTVTPPESVAPTDERRGLERLAETWKTCARRASERGVRVVWEFEPCFAFNKPSQIEDVLRAVDEPNFGVLFDTCHAHTVAALGARQTGDRETLPGGAIELLERLRDWIGAIHVIDTDGSLHDGSTSAHLPLGAGVLDFDALVPALLKCGAPTDWWCVDLCFCPTAWESAGPCKNTLAALLAKYER
ncbi:MAG: sugar phosphate isomerase/epimerase [Isosphaeraceae bacterium]|nr:sugar phosphate isomerase/epimerase [Isosphaeraceae bacterium]